MRRRVRLRFRAERAIPAGEHALQVTRLAFVVFETHAALDAAKDAVKDITSDLCDVLIYALYPTTGMRFLRWKHGLEEPPAEVKPKTLEECEAEADLVAEFPGKHRSGIGAGSRSDTQSGQGRCR